MPRAKIINGRKLYLYHDRYNGLFRVHDGTAQGPITLWCSSAKEAWACARNGEWCE